MDTEQMIELARTIQAEGVWTNVDGRNDDDVFAWVDALLAEHDARVAAERERDDALLAAGHLSDEIATLEAERDAAERRVKVREDQVGIWKTLLYRRIGTLEERLHHLEAVAGNVVLVDDEADLLVPDWQAVVEALREAIDALRVALGDEAARTAAILGEV